MAITPGLIQDIGVRATRIWSLTRRTRGVKRASRVMSGLSTSYFDLDEFNGVVKSVYGELGILDKTGRYKKEH
jgi:hypothetical protein